MLNAESPTTDHCVIVLQAGVVILKGCAINVSAEILLSPTIIQPSCDISQPNAEVTTNVHMTKHVSTRNALIHVVQVNAVKAQNA